MLHGRRVLSSGDALLVSDPHNAGGGATTSSGQLKSGCYAANSSTTNLAITASNQQEGAPEVPPYHWQANPTWTHLAVDDFNYDGVEEMVFLNIDVLQVVAAVDPADPSKGLHQPSGVSTKLPSGALRAPLNEPATGDFNSDGLIDVAWIGGNFPNASGTLSVFFATICPGDVAGTICAGAAAFHVILDPASKEFAHISGATSTIVLDDASLTRTDCGALSSDSKLGVAGSDVYRAGAIALGNFEDSGFLNRFGAPRDELVVTYVSGTTRGGGSNKCSVDVQYWSYSTPTSASPVWAKRGDTVTNLLPEANQPGAWTMYQLYSTPAYLDWYGDTEQVATALSASYGYPDGVGLPPTSYWRPMTTAVSGSGNDASLAVCAARTSNKDDNGSTFWGVAAGRFSTSTTISEDNPSACTDFANSSPGECPYNPEIAVLLGVDNTSHRANEEPPRPTLELYTVEPSQPKSAPGKTCLNDASVQGYLPVRSTVTPIGGFTRLQANSRFSGSQVRAGDAFGDYVRVGTPTITRIDTQSVPQFIIQAPPSTVQRESEHRAVDGLVHQDPGYQCRSRRRRIAA